MSPSYSNVIIPPPPATGTEAEKLQKEDVEAGNDSEVEDLDKLSLLERVRINQFFLLWIGFLVL